MFIDQFKMLSNLGEERTKKIGEVLVFGGIYPLSLNQVSALASLVV